MWAIMEAGLSGARAGEALPRSSPLAVVLTQQFQDAGAAALLPPVLLCHGTADASTPASQSEAFGSALRLAGLAKVEARTPGLRGRGSDTQRGALGTLRVPVCISRQAVQWFSKGGSQSDLPSRRPQERYYQGKSHTDPFLEDPILGGRDELLDDVTAIVHGTCPGECMSVVCVSDSRKKELLLGDRRCLSPSRHTERGVSGACSHALCVQATRSPLRTA